MNYLSTNNAALTTSLTGSLYKGPQANGDVFKARTVPVSFRIISTKQTYIVPTMSSIKDITYIVRDKKMTVPLGVFTQVDTDTALSMVFDLTVDGPGVVDNAMIKQSVIGGVNPTLKIYTTDNTKIGYQ